MTKNERFKTRRIGKKWNNTGNNVKTYILNAKVLHITLLFFLSIHFCFGNNDKNVIPETEMLTTEFSIHSDSLDLQKGIYYVEKSEYDSARYFLLKSAESPSIPIKTESYLYLNFIETRLQNYDLALVYLEQYHKNAMLLFNRALEAEDSIKNHKDNINETINSIENQSKKELRIIIIFCVILVLIIFLLIYLQQKKLFIFSNHRKAELDRLNSVIQLKIKKKQSLSYDAYLLQAETFKQTAIYAEIKDLETQQRNRNAKVLTNEKQHQLKQEIDRIFKNFQDELNGCGAKLTENDIKLCCLSLLPLSSYAKALCFGSTETNITKQRKHYIKKKMTEDSDNSLLFDFIFSLKE